LHLADNGQLTLSPEAVQKRKASKTGRPTAHGKTKARSPATARAKTKPGSQHALKKISKSTQLAHK